MSGPRALVMAGSLRRASLNRRLAAVMARALADCGAEVDAVDMADFRVPVYDGDLEEREGVPEAARRLSARMQAADGFVLACPEYNGGTPGALKNLIDWVSRPCDGVPGTVAFRDKLVLLVAASPGAVGGLRGLAHTRATLTHLGAVVLPDQLTLPNAESAFDAYGELVDERVGRRARTLAARWVDAAQRWRSAGGVA